MYLTSPEGAIGPFSPRLGQEDDAPGTGYDAWCSERSELKGYSDKKNQAIGVAWGASRRDGGLAQSRLDRLL